jgi:ribosome biogenesis GTPase / thiamine phosphate phosphatase
MSTPAFPSESSAVSPSGLPGVPSSSAPRPGPPVSPSGPPLSPSALPGADWRSLLPDGWRERLAELGADEATLTQIETSADAAADASGPARGGPSVPGRVTRAEISLATVLTPAGPLRASLSPAEPVCAGDWVLVRPDDPVVTQVLPRRTALTRHAAGKKTEAQTLAANVDDVFITVAADRSVSLDRIERFLALAWESGATPVVVLTKRDLLAPEAATPLLTSAMGAAPGAEVYLVSVVTGEGIDELSQRIRPGRTAALIGSSGAGKSSLLNALAGAEVAATSEVRDADGKGKHKTAWRELVVLDQGGAIIDTPGLRGLGLWLDGDGLEATFADITELAAGCRFADCQHDTEPGCAVTAAIASGELEARRLDSYRKLEREAAYVARKTDVRARRAEARIWASRIKDAQGRTRQDPRYS